jgi:hypothetical protein
VTYTDILRRTCVNVAACRCDTCQSDVGHLRRLADLLEKVWGLTAEGNMLLKTEVIVAMTDPLSDP